MERCSRGGGVTAVDRVRAAPLEGVVTASMRTRVTGTSEAIADRWATDGQITPSRPEGPSGWQVPGPPRHGVASGRRCDSDHRAWLTKWLVAVNSEGMTRAPTVHLPGHDRLPGTRPTTFLKSSAQPFPYPVTSR